MAVARVLRLIILLISTLLISCPLMIIAASEADALLKFKNSLTNSNSLASWLPNSTPCNGDQFWRGIVCYRNTVTGLRLGGMGLSGKIDVDALLALQGLRTVSISNNSFSGTIPEFNRIGALKALYLSGNQFSGDIPSDYFSKMESLKKVWLNDNKFTGEIPSSLFQLPHLMVLHLENNQFNGAIPSFNQPATLMSLNLSNNKLEGDIPASLSKFNASSFAGNAGLCGEKLGTTCEMKAAAGVSPAADPDSAANAQSSGSKKTLAAVITLGVMLFSVAVILIVRWRRKKEDDFDVLEEEISTHDADAVAVRVTAQPQKETELSRKSSSRKGSHRGGGIGELVMLNDSKGVFGLPDLMKAAAEVLGNGSLGASYKAVMANGVAVVVKRMREMNALGRDGFDAEMKKIGTLSHPNILTPLAYHFRKDEKLLIYEYIPKGSLLYQLHGDRGPSHAELNWPARLKIIQGIAKGLGYLHTELGKLDVPHGNLKSSNVLLGPDNEPMLADYGFNPLINASNNGAPPPLLAFKSPEAAQIGKASPKCDVYCLGLIILEILTGKFPSQYLSNGKGGTDIIQWVASAISEGREMELLDPEIASSRNSLGEMERLFHVGAACTETNPELRLGLGEAIIRIQEIQIEGAPQRTMEVLPSLRDGYADEPHSSSFNNLREGFGEQSNRNSAASNRPGSSDSDYFTFGIS